MVILPRLANRGRSSAVDGAGSSIPSCDFYLFHLGYPQVSARYNAIGSFSRITEVATRIANQLPSEGNSAAVKEFACRFVNIIARALVALGRRPDYQQVRRYINDIEPLFVEYAREHLRRNGDENWENAVAEIGENTKERNLPAALRGRHPEAIALMRYLQEQDLYDPVLDSLVSAFKYDKTYFDKIVRSVGPLMEKLTTGKIAELISPDYLDEADNRPIFEWLEVIRRKGIVYVGLDALTDQLPKVEVFTLMSVSGVDDSSDPTSGVDFKSRNEDRISDSEVPMRTPAELVALPKGQAFALLEGGQLWKLRMPLPDPRNDPIMPESLTAIDYPRGTLANCGPNENARQTRFAEPPGRTGEASPKTKFQSESKSQEIPVVQRPEKHRSCQSDEQVVQPTL